MNRRQKAVVYIFTGEGKAKTSAALGVGARAAAVGMKVAMVCWYKCKEWDVSEYQLGKKLPGFQIFPMGVGFRIRNYESKITNKQGKTVKTASLSAGGKVVDNATKEEHKEAAKAALEKARELVREVDVLILDEVNNAVKDDLIDLNALIDLISKRGKVHLILTGRDACAELVEVADLVTEMKKIKHPFDKGKKAVKGLDY